MESIRIDILNPKAKKLLKGLADLDLIKIKTKSYFSFLLKKLQAKSKEELSPEDIAKEVEEVRKLRYGNHSK
jgi:hypothetical protein